MRKGKNKCLGLSYSGSRSTRLFSPVVKRSAALWQEYYPVLLDPVRNLLMQSFFIPTTADRHVLKGREGFNQAAQVR